MGAIANGSERDSVLLTDPLRIFACLQKCRSPFGYRAGIVAHPKDYRWSSYQRRALGRADRLLPEDPCYEGLGTAANETRKYRGWIDYQIDGGNWDEIRHAKQRGRLIGWELFQKQVEEMTGRRWIGRGAWST
jgi:hypothetical protein